MFPAETRVILAQAGESVLPEALMLMVVGMFVVFAALVLLLIAIAVIHRLGERPEAPASAGALAGRPRAGPGAAPGEIDRVTVAVLAAAATAALRRPIQVTDARQTERRS